MVKLRNLLARLRSDENGATAIEYGLLAALIAVAIITAAGVIGRQLNQGFTAIQTDLATADGITADGTGTE